MKISTFACERPVLVKGKTDDNKTMLWLDLSELNRTWPVHSAKNDSAWREFLINGDWSASLETTEWTNRKI